MTAEGDKRETPNKGQSPSTCALGRWDSTLSQIFEGVFAISLSSFLRHGPVCRSTCRCKRRRGYPRTVQRTQQEGTIGQMLNPSAWSQCPLLHSEALEARWQLISFLCSDVLPSLSGMSKTVQENLEDIRRSSREPPPSSVLRRTEPRPCAC